MRNQYRSLLLAGGLAALALPAGAVAPISGFTAPGNCVGIFDAESLDCELYVLKIPDDPMAARTDWRFDLKGDSAASPRGVSDSGTDLVADGWGAADRWRVPQTGGHVHFVYITCPPAGPGEGGQVVLDSGTALNFDFQAAGNQIVGDAITVDATNGLVLPRNSSAQFSVNVGRRSFMFPVGTTTTPGTTPIQGVNIVFAPLADINNLDLGGGCTPGGRNANTTDTVNSPTTIGGVVGYNVWRIEGSAGTVPTPANFLAAMNDGDATTGWIYYIDLRRIGLRTMDSLSSTVGTLAAAELNATTGADLAGIHNPDGRMYSGDELVIFQDTANNRGISGNPLVTASRPAGSEPMPGKNYWYAVQPCGDASIRQAAGTDDWDNVGFTTNTTFAGEHRMDLDANGSFDAVDLDRDGTPEFISPQAQFDSDTAAAGIQGFPGVGLTVNNVPLLSAPMFFNSTLALPATGQVQLSGSMSGDVVNLQIAGGLEAGNEIMGYNVYRVSGDSRVRVNEQPILREGGEANVYQVVDRVVHATRGVRGSLQYMVEIVYSDTSRPSEMVGPFTVSVERTLPGRRQR